MHGYSDQPAQQDELGFTPAATALAAIINETQQADTPLTIGIYGPWGSGKTSMMRMVRDALRPEKHITIEFEAWRYAQQEALWRALLLSVVDKLRKEFPDEGLQKELNDLETSLYRSVEREEPGAFEFQWGKAGKLAANTVIRAGFSYIPVLGQLTKAVDKANEAAGGENYADEVLSLFERQRTQIYQQHVQSLEQFHRGLQRVIKEFVTDFDRRLVIFIDDLDRCLPDQAIGVLEALKVFLDLPGCVAVLGMDQSIVQHGIRVRYKEFTLSPGLPAGSFPVAERDYLEKIVQIPFTLPPLDPNLIRRFLLSRLPGVSGLTDAECAQVADLMTKGLLRNPRKVKRSFNIFRLHLNLDRAHGRTTPPGLIAKLTVIQTSFADLYEYIALDPLVLRQIEQIVRGTPGAGSIDQTLREAVGQSDERLRAMLFQAPFFETLGDPALRELVYQSQVTDATGGIA